MDRFLFQGNYRFWRIRQCTCHMNKFIQGCHITASISWQQSDRYRRTQHCVFCLVCPITRSTWILTEAKPLVAPTSSALRYIFPFVKAGICKLTAYKPTVYPTLKPHSAKIKSPGVILSKNPQCSVISFWLTLPPNPLDMKDMVSCGVNQLSTSWCYDIYR